MSDVVERLRERAEYDDLKILLEAADEIERLRALILDGCEVFEHYDLPEHAFHYRRILEKRPRTTNEAAAIRSAP